MKKIAVLVVVLLLLTTVSAFSVGIGISAGLPLGEGLPGSNVLLSAKIDQIPFLLGLGFGFDPFYLGVTADWWALNENLAGALNVYLGPGLYVGVGGNTVSLGGRLPIGINIFPVDFLELFVEIAPTLAILPSGSFPDIGVQAAAGFRFWF